MASFSATGRQAWVGVGYDNPNGRPVTVAVLHLARIGAGADAPWEVVEHRAGDAESWVTGRYQIATATNPPNTSIDRSGVVRNAIAPASLPAAN